MQLFVKNIKGSYSSTSSNYILFNLCNGYLNVLIVLLALTKGLPSFTNTPSISVTINGKVLYKHFYIGRIILILKFNILEMIRFII